MRKILTVVLILLCLNSFSFIIARIIFCLNGGTAAKLEHKMVDKENDTMTYLIAGNLNQPLAAYQFLEPELHGHLTYAQFRMLGWNARATAERIANEVKCMHLSKVVVYTISLGDHVGRYLEAMLGDYCELQIIAINPCTDVSFMCNPLGILLKIGSPFFELVCHGLGWLSAIPCIPASGGNYSPILLADQYWSIAYDRPKHAVKNTIGVICSKPDIKDNDGLLENAMIRAYFQYDLTDEQSVQIITIDTDHGDTIGCGDAYLLGVQRILYGL